MKTISIVVLLGMAAVCHAQYQHLDLGFLPGARSSNSAFTLYQSVGAPLGGISSSPLFVARHGFLSAVQIPGTTDVPAQPNTARPAAYSLRQNYPNPFNPSTTISYGLPKRSRVTLTVHDVLGQVVATLVDEDREPGLYHVRFDARGMASGMYFYRITAGDFVDSRKLIILK
jgi:hypothetical protein